MRNFIRTFLSFSLLVCVTAVAWSSEADELRAKAKAVQKEAEQLAKDGHPDEADKHFRAVKELLQAAERHEQKSPKSANSNNEIEQLHQQLKALAQKEQALNESENDDGLAELHKHRAGIVRMLAELEEHHGRKPGQKQVGKHQGKLPEGLDDAARRIRHIHIAIENLHAAGLHDVAEELAKRAEAMKHEVHQAHERATKELPSPKKELPSPKKGKQADPVDELRHEIQRLRDELNELRQEVKKR